MKKAIPLEWIDNYIRDMLEVPYGQRSPGYSRDEMLSKAAAILNMKVEWEKSQQSRPR